MSLEASHILTQLLYLSASLLFILGLRGLGHPDKARRGIMMAEVGMLFAIVGTLINHNIVRYEWIIAGIVIGGGIGTAISLKIPMTKMPERIALSHAFGGLAVALVGIASYYSSYVSHEQEVMTTLDITATSLECLFGALTFTGSLMAFGKLQGLIGGKPITYPAQNAINYLLIAGTLALVGFLIWKPASSEMFYVVTAAGLALGVLLVLPIGGADMPVVICLLNSYAGLAAAATGFATHNNILIICGALDGGSGFLLGVMMSKAMNRSFYNVVFGAFGATPEAAPGAAAAAATGPAPNEGTVDDAVEILRAARSLIVIPGYGMAVSQAQHAVRDLAAVLKTGGCEVRYAIHPVAGRMPGHMNVLLAEANIPYDQLFDLDAINDDFVSTDVALVVGANDVVNPAAKTNPGSPIYGMPVFDVESARSTIILKRSLNPGFAGIENELFVKPKTMMVLGDAKKTLMAFTAGLKD